MCFPTGNAATQQQAAVTPSRSMAEVQQRAQAVTRLDQSPTVFTSPLGISTNQPRPINRTILTGSL